MKLTKSGVFKVGKSILLFKLCLSCFFSYAETTLSGSDSLETTSFTTSREEDFSNPVGNSMLSLKGEVLAMTSVFFREIVPVVPISLEFQIPFKGNKRLKWLVLTGGGVVFDKIDDNDFYLYFSLDTGLRYDFQPWAFSLTAGGVITSDTFDIFEKGKIYAVHPVATLIEWALSAGRDIANIHVALTVGSFAYI